MPSALGGPTGLAADVRPWRDPGVGRLGRPQLRFGRGRIGDLGAGLGGVGGEILVKLEHMLEMTHRASGKSTPTIVNPGPTRKGRTPLPGRKFRWGLPSAPVNVGIPIGLREGQRVLPPIRGVAFRPDLIPAAAVLDHDMVPVAHGDEIGPVVPARPAALHVTGLALSRAEPQLGPVSGRHARPAHAARVPPDPLATVFQPSPGRLGDGDYHRTPRAPESWMSAVFVSSSASSRIFPASITCL